MASFDGPGVIPRSWSVAHPRAPRSLRPSSPARSADAASERAPPVGNRHPRLLPDSLTFGLHARRSSSVAATVTASVRIVPATRPNSALLSRDKLDEDLGRRQELVRMTCRRVARVIAT